MSPVDSMYLCVSSLRFRQLGTDPCPAACCERETSSAHLCLPECPKIGTVYPETLQLHAERTGRSCKGTDLTTVTYDSSALVSFSSSHLVLNILITMYS